MFVISLALLVKPVEHKKNWSGFVGDKAPSTAWHTAAALAAIEILLFAISTFIMWKVSSRRM
ncbi:hypothetical protein K440DRAFT_617330 [Wilcoxina mikolae CBS 423.85]|nr:hypothetical protein K440DRAFT_617330 [Wilcoxina mikolae CBS 423.85]